LSDPKDHQLEPGSEQQPASLHEQALSLMTRAMELLDSSDGPAVIRARLADLISDLAADEDDRA